MSDNRCGVWRHSSRYKHLDAYQDSDGSIVICDEYTGKEIRRIKLRNLGVTNIEQ